MKVVVIGGGAAGMVAAITSARNNNDVVILEKTDNLGSKLKITGKGRCNITFSGDIEDFKKNVVKNNKFMYSSFSNFSNTDVINFFNSLGVETKVERGARIFPVSDNANDVVNALKKELNRLKVNIRYNSKVEHIITKDNIVQGVRLEDGTVINCDKCILTTGGNSYKKTGSSGDGYKIAKELGHEIVDIKPGLVPLKSDDIVCKMAQGLSLKNIFYKVYLDNKVIFEEFGELMFAHFGLTRPVVLSSSSKINRLNNLEENFKNKKINAVIDLKPALDFDTLYKRICRDFDKYSNKEFKNSLNDLLPQKLIPVIIKLSNIKETKKVHQITKEERHDLCNLIKNLKINITGFMPMDIAIITCGGVSVKQINPKTMESKLVKGLYFAGEVLDIDGYTGGYNLQIAFSTAYAAGQN